MIVMFDTVTVDTVPDNPQAVAGYTSGNWPTYNPLVQKFPNALHLSIAVQAYDWGRCLDVEPGDATATQAAAWFNSDRCDKSHGLPVLYTSASNVQELINALAAAGIQRSQYLIWSAHYTYREHICAPNVCGYPQADGTQWTDRAFGRNLDQSVVSDTFFGPPPPPPDPHHYLWFYPGPFESPWGPLNEREVVLRYDGARKHWVRYRGLLGLLRAQLAFLEHRVYIVAHSQPEADGKPSWGRFNRGWRFQALSKRAHGDRFA